MSFESKVQVLETDLRKLILDWERFFCGDIRVPPHADRDRLQRRLRMLAEQPSTRRAEQFRLEQLQHKFMTYYQLWERQLKEREEGRTASGGYGTLRPASVPATNAKPAASVGEEGSDALFEKYLAAKRRVGGDVNLDRTGFERQIERQRQEIESRLGRKVQFDVVVEGKKVKLAARTVNSKGRKD